jgi:hypothetical protein
VTKCITALALLSALHPLLPLVLIMGLIFFAWVNYILLFPEVIGIVINEVVIVEDLPQKGNFMNGFR